MICLYLLSTIIQKFSTHEYRFDQITFILQDLCHISPTNKQLVYLIYFVMIGI